MVDVRSNSCVQGDCGKQPLFGVVGTRKREYCEQHAGGCIVNEGRKKGVHGDSSQPASHIMTGATEDGMGEVTSPEW